MDRKGLPMRCLRASRHTKGADAEGLFHLFTYWLAEQRSPVLAVGLISFSSVRPFPFSFCKTRTLKNLLPISAVRGWRGLLRARWRRATRGGPRWRWP